MVTSSSGEGVLGSDGVPAWTPTTRRSQSLAFARKSVAEESDSVMAFLFATPLVDDEKPDQAEHQANFPMLDAASEEKAIREAHYKSNSSVRLLADPCTEGKFSDILVRGIRCLHYMGHGVGDSLLFENDEAKVAILSS